ncbi:MAG: 50S ribosomal protein L5 [Candidatus Omnitrophica bacterium]|nr:50S ribosomal protein L5 [Candidatus Omnitrophota bacterium]
MKPRLLEKYQNEVMARLMETFQYRNVYQVPALEKIVVNMGVGVALTDPAALEKAQEELAAITGQRPLVTKAKKAISNFKLRKGAKIGCKVTLRGFKMYEFFDKLVNVALPRIRDFRGVNPDSFDGGGNYALGITEQHIFPEIEFDKVQRTQGFDVAIVTTAKTTEEARELLFQLGMPFRGYNREENRA